MHLFPKIQYFYEKVQDFSKTVTFVGKGTPEPLIFLSISMPFHLGAPEVYFIANTAFLHKMRPFSENITFPGNPSFRPWPSANESPELTLFRGPQRVFH